ncbi:MAG TPA: peptidoglycan-binding domain-containing protein, partial [Gaiellaceae bacterium]|nr:peptidoglycan-binding domain-containing protein [Gaiellaceae bacterium]
MSISLLSAQDDRKEGARRESAKTGRVVVYRQVAALSALLLLVWPVVGADAAGAPAVAALQVALLRKGVYVGAVDGVAGPLTRAAVRRLQARDGLVVDGIAGPETRRALG